MGKANKFLDLFFHNIFYKDKVKVLVRTKIKTLETHYYPIGEKNKLVIYTSAEDVEKNPTIEGEGITLDADHKSEVLLWEEGSDYVRPIFDTSIYGAPKITSQHGFRLVDLGRRLHELSNPWEKMKSDEGKIILGVVIILFICILNAFLTWSIVQEMGIKLLGGG